MQEESHSYKCQATPKDELRLECDQYGQTWIATEVDQRPQIIRLSDEDAINLATRILARLVPGIEVLQDTLRLAHEAGDLMRVQISQMQARIDELERPDHAPRRAIDDGAW